MNFLRVSPDLLLGGVVVSDQPRVTTASKKRLREERDSIVTTADLLAAAVAVHRIDDEASREFDGARRKSIDEYLMSEGYRTDLLAEMRTDIEQALNHSHDFLLLLKQIRQNIVTVFEERFSGLPPEEAADRLPNEGAVFFAAELMLAKIDATKYLREPNLVYGNVTSFALHRFVSKYIKIYQSYARQRDLDFFTSGESRGWVSYNGEAIGAAVLAVLDNVVKYAPAGSKVDIVFTESSDEIEVRFVSLGPRIKPEETSKIFQVGFRGEAARELETGGLGFGLAAAFLISSSLGLGLTAKQGSDEEPKFPNFFNTEFSYTFEKEFGGHKAGTA
jgi:signal transduction histidine kinase